MRIRLHKPLRLFIILSLSLFFLIESGHAQFIFFYDGLDTIAVNENCVGSLFSLDEQGNEVNNMDTTPPFTPAVSAAMGQNIEFASIDAALTGFGKFDPIPVNTTVTVAFVAGDNLGNVDTFYFDVTFVDLTPPVFTDPIPNDTIVECAFGLFPAPVLTAMDNCDPSFPMTIIPVVDPAGSINNCAADTITRTWTATDVFGNIVTAMQTIIILPDTEPPVIDFPFEADEVECGDEMDFQTWLMAKRMKLSAEATDNCGIANVIDDNPKFPIGCSSVTVTFSVIDLCGLNTDWEATFSIVDTEDPLFFDVPADTMIYCNQTIPDTAVVTVSDNCSSVDTIIFSEISTQTMNGSCTDFEYTITRNWTAMDSCGNSGTATQVITVQDGDAPSFTIPADITVDCETDLDNLLILGDVTDESDNCDGSVLDAAYVDIVDSVICGVSVIISREWRVEDICGNDTVKIQTITIEDNVSPTFAVPSDITVDCSNTITPEEAFNDWISERGGAIAMDNCSPDSSLLWFAYNAGSTDIASLPAVSCPAPSSGAFRSQTVDFVVKDECGNSTTSTAIFSISDNTPPEFQVCPSDLTLSTDPGECSIAFTLSAPVVTEECGGLVAPFSHAALSAVHSENPGDSETPIAPLVLNFLVPSAPVFATGEVELLIRLQNVDAEEPTEYFDIFSEDGIFLGQTNLTPSQCDTSETIIHSINIEQLNHWANDGIISIKLEPFIPATQPGRFSINDICPGGTVFGQITYQTVAPEGLALEYSIDGGSRSDYISNMIEMLPIGSNTITYFATDCAGNSDSCSYVITVEDLESPRINCPNDISVSLEEGACTAEVILPFPKDVNDNCGFSDMYSQVQPFDSSDAFLTFNYNPNLIDYIAEDRSITFTGVAANATGPVTLSVHLQGDVESPNEFFTFIGENGIALGTTEVGQPNVINGNCDIPGLTTLLIPADTFNVWAVDGIISLSAISNTSIPIPPGGPGDGINPCQPVMAAGAIDSTSYMFVTLSYNEVALMYYGEGATEIPLSNMMLPQINPVYTFNVGTSMIHYIEEDIHGNADTCSFLVIVEDNEPPQAICQPTTVFVNPGGTSSDAIHVSDIDVGSSDNCLIDTMFITPSIFTCTSGGNVVPVTLTVIDQSGNISTCVADVLVETESLQPTFSVGVCGSDSLFLFANTPEAPGNIVYTYLWTGPNDFISNLENPIIPNVSSMNAGSYAVQITGITGCTAFGVVEVDIEALPITPSIAGPEAICSNEDIFLTSSSQLSGTSVTYRWYEGNAPDGTLMGITNVPSFTISAPHLSEGVVNYYMTIEIDGCVSQESPPLSIQVTGRPVAIPINTEIGICEGETITLGTFVGGEDIIYNWTGPNGYISTNQFPPTIPNATLANSGVYTLIVSENGCKSESAFTIVNIIPMPEAPLITNDGPVCVGEDLKLVTNVNNANVYRWISPTFQEQITVVNTLVLNNATESDAGLWSVYITQFGCDSDPATPTSVVINPSPQIIASANPNELCEGEDLQLFTTPTLANAAYQWSGPNDFFTATQNPLISSAGIEDEGMYFVTVTNQNGCSSTKNVEVSVFQGVRVTAVSNDGSTCLNGPTDIKLVATVFPPNDGSYLFEWTGPNDFFSTDSIATIPNATSINNGNYQVMVYNGEGCISNVLTTTVDVTDPPATPAAPVISLSTPSPFCEGDMVTFITDAYSGTSVLYSWTTPIGTVITMVPSLTIHSLTSSDNGGYSVQVTVDGCESNESGYTFIEVNSIPSIQASSNSPACEDGIIELFAEFVLGSEYLWTGPSGFTSSVYNPIISPADPTIHSGTYTVRVTTNGCTSYPASVNIVVNNIPNIPIAVNNGPICLDDPESILLLAVTPASATPGAVYTWYDQVGNQLGDPSSSLTFNLTNFSIYGDGNFEFYSVASLNGCSSAPSIPTAVSLSTIPDNEAYAGEDIQICEGGIVNLNATAPTIGTGLWQQVGGNSDGLVIANPDAANTTVSGLDEGDDYIFRWSLSNGACQDYSFDDVNVFVDMIELADAGDNVEACMANTVNLNAVPPISGSGFWKQPEVQELFGVTIVEPENPTTVISGLEPGNQYLFTWILLDNGCGESSDDVLVIVSNDVAYAGESFDECSEGCTELMALPPASGTGRWSSPNQFIDFTDSTNPEAVACGLEEGENMFIWTINEGACGDAGRDTISVYFKKTPVANPDEVIVPFAGRIDFNVIFNDEYPLDDFLVKITSGPEYGTLDTLGNGLYSYLADINFAGVDKLTYELCSESCACSSATVSFYVGDDAACEAPNIITPNNDGINDAFVVPCLSNIGKYESSQVSIFNQWGDEVFRSQRPYENNWKGTFDGQDLPLGTYFYIIDFGNEIEPQSGYLIIQR